VTRLARALAHAGAAVTVALLLYASLRPLYTDDAWWHLKLGEAYLASGPWLDADPMLFTAIGPPAPASWLFDLGAFALLRGGDFAALRGARLAIAAILGAAWWLLG
jgi:hypothetical protein